ILVLQGFGITSFTWAFLVSSIIGVPFYYMISPWKIGFGIYKSSLRHLKFGIQFQAKNILATIKDDLLIAFLPKFISYAEIGYIGFAQRLAFFVYRYVVDSLTKVTFASYSRMQDNTEFLRKAIEKSLFFVGITMFPLLIGLMVTIPFIIDYFPRWNNKWEPAILSVIFFSMNALVSSISGVLVNVLDASGKVTKTLQLMVIWTILTWVLTPIAIILFGYTGVAATSFLISLSIVYTVYLVKKQVQFSVIRPLIKPGIAAGTMGICAFLGGQLFVTNLVTLFALIVVSGGIYGAIMYMTAKNEIIQDIQKFILKK
ncbi:MAG TPA: oligosaccharide flippase family protein, partial [Candidatus Woesebacteria bacterium]|nr:oligosaccharide flippase family protein [Candidatus Woesebacteria bacterium]